MDCIWSIFRLGGAQRELKGNTGQVVFVVTVDILLDGSVHKRTLAHKHLNSLLNVNVEAEYNLSNFNVLYLKIFIKVTYVGFCTTILVYLENLILFYHSNRKKKPEI
jgi:hypothetical protein